MVREHHGAQLLVRFTLGFICLVSKKTTQRQHYLERDNKREILYNHPLRQVVVRQLLTLPQQPQKIAEKRKMTTILPSRQSFAFIGTEIEPRANHSWRRIKPETKRPFGGPRSLLNRTTHCCANDFQSSREERATCRSRTHRGGTNRMDF